MPSPYSLLAAFGGSHSHSLYQLSYGGIFQKSKIKKQNYYNLTALKVN
jgi:hypothetical protein